MIKYYKNGRQISGKEYKNIKAQSGIIDEGFRLVNQYGITQAVKKVYETEAERIRKCGL